MVTKMKKTKCMGTSKNKRVMSGGGGGKGRVSRYTKKFRKCYENFRKIAESNTNDIINDDTKIRKMEEWGRLRGIYTYLKSKKLEGNEETFLEKMKGNLGDNFNKYTDAVSCLENDSAILLDHGCVLEKDYVNSKESAGIPIVESKKANVISENIEVDEVEQANEKEEEKEEEEEEEEGEMQPTEVKTAKANEGMQQDEANAAKANEEEEEMQQDQAALSTIEGNDQSETGVQSTPVRDAENDNKTNQKLPLVDTPANTSVYFDPYANIPNAKQGGGRSKRRQKYSRSRGKSMKSKKGRKTRRH